MNIPYSSGGAMLAVRSGADTNVGHCHRLRRARDARRLTHVNDETWHGAYKNQLARRMTAQDQNAEFRRQLRSLFALLRAIVRRSAEGERSKSDYAAHLEGRIGTLARVHDMLMRAPE